MFFMSTIPMARSISTSLGIWLTKESGLTSGNARPRAADPVGAGKDGALNPKRALRASWCGLRLPSLLLLCVFRHCADPAIAQFRCSECTRAGYNDTLYCSAECMTEARRLHGCRSPVKNKNAAPLLFRFRGFGFPRQL